MTYLFEAAIDPLYYLLTVAAFVIYLFFFRKWISSWIDPLFSFLIWLSFSSSFVFFLYLKNGIKPFYLIAYVSMLICFLIGTYPFRQKDLPPAANEGFKGNLDLMLFTVMFLTLFIGIGFLFRLSTHGAAIFSDDATTERVEISQQSRLVDALFYSIPVAIIGGLFVVALTKSLMKKFIGYTCIAILFVCIVLGGSKSAVLGFIFAIGSLPVILKNNIQTKVFISKLYKTSIWLLAPAAVAFAIFFILKSGAESPLMTLFIRFTGYGDVYVYYFVEDLYRDLVGTYNFITYFLHVIANRIGLSSNPNTIGTELFGRYTGNYDGFGPNPHFTTEGLIMFGYPLALVYALFIGYGFGWMRRYANDCSKTSNVFKIFLGATFLTCMDSLPVDILLFQARFLSAFLSFFVCYMLATVVTKAATIEVKN